MQNHSSMISLKNKVRYVYFRKLYTLFGVLFLPSYFGGVSLGLFCQEKRAVLFGIGMFQMFT